MTEQRNYVLIFLLVSFGVSYLIWIFALVFMRGNLVRFMSFSFAAMVGPALGTLTVKILGWKKDKIITKEKIYIRILWGLSGCLVTIAVYDCRRILEYGL